MVLYPLPRPDRLQRRVFLVAALHLAISGIRAQLHLRDLVLLRLQYFLPHLRVQILASMCRLVQDCTYRVGRNLLWLLYLLLRRRNFSTTLLLPEGMEITQERKLPHLRSRSDYLLPLFVFPPTREKARTLRRGKRSPLPPHLLLPPLPRLPKKKPRLRRR